MNAQPGLSDDARRTAALGVIVSLIGHGLWGIAVVLYKWLDHVSPFEILAHRAIWSVALVMVLILIYRRFRHIAVMLKNKRLMALLLVTSLLVGANWYLFIWAVAQSWIVEASLGYYINPLISVLIGVWLLSERLSRAQLVSVALAALAVANLTIGLGSFPWIAMFLAVSFAVYGYMRKVIVVDALDGLFAETLYLLPMGLIYLSFMTVPAGGVFVTGDDLTRLLLIATGPMTALPLLCLAYSARRIRLTTLGLLHYISPTINFLLAVLLYGEELTSSHIITFGLIWASLAIFSFDTWRVERELRRMIPAAP